MDEYFKRTGYDVASWIHARNRLPSSTKLTSFLQYIVDKPVQIAYLNVAAMNQPLNFKLLCDFIQQKNVWAINLGECEFNGWQCAELIRSVQQSNICFMFVDIIFVGMGTVSILKSIIRQHRQKKLSPPWLLGENRIQNCIIMQCTKMWWNPSSVGRNKDWISASKFESSREVGELKSQF